MTYLSRDSEWRIKLPKAGLPEPELSTRISVRLEALRNKQHSVLKKLKFMKKARRKFSFSDFELKTDLKDRQPDKELFLYLLNEKKRLQEKCFFAEVATKKCQVMTEFYADCNDRLINVMDQASMKSSNSEVEQMLQSFHEEITKNLEDARKKLLTQRKLVNKKSKDVNELEDEISKAKKQMSKLPQLLKARLAKGEILNDQEIMQLSLGTCLDTNMRLAMAVQSHGQHSDELQEKFIWKRDEFIDGLARGHMKALMSIYTPKFELSTVDERSDPPTPKGSMYDVMLGTNDIISALARIGRCSEETSKFHYKLRDLKERIREASRTKDLQMVRSSENSMITVISNIRTSVNPSNLQLPSLRRIN